MDAFMCVHVLCVCIHAYMYSMYVYICNEVVFYANLLFYTQTGLGFENPTNAEAATRRVWLLVCEFFFEVHVFVKCILHLCV